MITIAKTKFEQDLYSILQEACSSEVLQAVTDSMLYAGKATFQSKKESLKNSAVLVKRMLKSGGGKILNFSCRVKETGWRATLLMEIEEIAKGFGDAGRQIADNFKRFRAMSIEEKKQQIVWGLAATMAALGTAGGLDAEGGVPDMDIAVFGIGGHRSIFFHSILAGFGTEFLIRFSFGLCRSLKHRLPESRHPVWNQLFELSERMESGAVAGSWFGIAVHLLQDANLFSASTKPYSDLPFSAPMEGHQALFAGNSAIAAVFAFDDEAKSKFVGK